MWFKHLEVLKAIQVPFWTNWVLFGIWAKIQALEEVRKPGDVIRLQWVIGWQSEFPNPVREICEDLRVVPEEDRDVVVEFDGIIYSIDRYGVAGGPSKMPWGYFREPPLEFWECLHFCPSETALGDLERMWA